MMLGGEDEDDLTLAQKQEEVKKLKNTMMKSISEKQHGYFIPWRDQHGRWQLVDLGYIFPWTTWTEALAALPKLAKGDAESAIPKIMAPLAIGGPVPDILTALMAGKDAFTGRDIVSPDSVYLSEQALDITNWLWGVVAPPFVTDKGPLGKIWNADDVDVLGKRKMTEAQMMARVFGINIYSFNPEMTRSQNIKKMRREIADMKQFSKYDFMGKERTPERTAAYRKEVTEKTKLLADKMRQYAKDSDIHPALRTMNRGNAIK